MRFCSHPPIGIGFGWWVGERFEALVFSNGILIQLIFQGPPKLFPSMISLILVSVTVPMSGRMCGSIGKPVTNSCGIHKAPGTVVWNIQQHDEQAVVRYVNVCN